MCSLEDYSDVTDIMSTAKINYSDIMLPTKKKKSVFSRLCRIEEEKHFIYKIKRNEKTNKLFNLDLPIVYTKGGNFKETGSDDMSDSILLYASTREKYRKKTKRREVKR